MQKYPLALTYSDSVQIRVLKYYSTVMRINHSRIVVTFDLMQMKMIMDPTRLRINRMECLYLALHSYLHHFQEKLQEMIDLIERRKYPLHYHLMATEMDVVHLPGMDFVKLASPASFSVLHSY